MISSAERSMPSCNRHSRSARTDKSSLSIKTPSQSKITRSNRIAPFLRRRWRHAGALQRLRLARGEDALVEIVDQLVEQAVPVDLGLEMEEHRAEADRGAVHEDKGARRRDAAQAADVAVHLLGDVAAIDPAILLLDLAAAVVEQRCVDETRPLVQDLDHRLRQVLEAPGLIGVDG